MVNYTSGTLYFGVVNYVAVYNKVWSKDYVKAWNSSAATYTKDYAAAYEKTWEGAIQIIEVRLMG